MKTKKTQTKSDLDSVVKTVEKTIDTIGDNSEKVMKPVRVTLFKRFPIGFVLLVAFGVSATTTAGQLLFLKVQFFVERPSVLLAIGLAALILTGKLHQKLG